MALASLVLVTVSCTPPISCVHHFRHIVECRKSDMVSTRQKNQAWEDIELRFNSSRPTSVRTAVQLRAKYKNMKRKLRSDVGDHKDYSKGTGGGPPLPDLDLSIMLLGG